MTMIKKINIAVWASFLCLFLLNCLTVKEKAIRKCRDTGADEVSVNETTGTTQAFGGLYAQSEGTSTKYNCKKLLSENKEN